MLSWIKHFVSYFSAEPPAQAEEKDGWDRAIERDPKNTEFWLAARAYGKRREANERIEAIEQQHLSGKGFRERIDSVGIRDLDGDPSHDATLWMREIGPDGLTRQQFVVKEIPGDWQPGKPPQRIELFVYPDLDRPRAALEQVVFIRGGLKPHEWAAEGVLTTGPRAGRRQRWTFLYDPF